MELTTPADSNTSPCTVETCRWLILHAARTLSLLSDWTNSGMASISQCAIITPSWLSPLGECHPIMGEHLPIMKHWSVRDSPDLGTMRLLSTPRPDCKARTDWMSQTAPTSCSKSTYLTCHRVSKEIWYQECLSRVAFSGSASVTVAVGTVNGTAISQCVHVACEGVHSRRILLV